MVPAMTEEQLVRNGIAMVHHAVSDLASRIPSHVNRSDLVSAGMLGLAQAARAYDQSRGVTFERFAAARIAARFSTSCAPTTGPAAPCGRTLAPSTSNPIV